MKAILVAAGALLLASCATPEQRAATFCQSQGFQNGTDQFSHCMSATFQAWAAQQAAYQNMQLMGLQMMQAGQPAQPAYQYRPFTCVRQGMFTNCY